MSKLNEITSKLGQAHDQWKEGERSKNKLKEEFFELAITEASRDTPAQSVVYIDAPFEIEARHLAEARNPRMKVLTSEHTDPEGTVWKIVLEEKPEFKTYTHINPEDGRVYTRQVVEGSPILDDERIKDENPDLWEKISTVPTERVLKPLDRLTSEELAAIQPYLYSAKPIIKLLSPRKAKPEELDDDI